jgi:hypothetical protein
VLLHKFVQATTALLDSGLSTRLNEMSNASPPKHALRIALWVLAALPAPALCQMLDVRDLNVSDIRSLDRQRTVVILQGGILKQHGPYLPIYTDGWTLLRDRTLRLR